MAAGIAALAGRGWTATAADAAAWLPPRGGRRGRRGASAARRHALLFWWAAAVALLWLAGAAARAPHGEIAVASPLREPPPGKDALACLLNTARGGARRQNWRTSSAMHADPLLAASAQEYADEAAVVQGFGLAWETDNSTALAAALQRRLRKHGVRHVEAATVLAAGFADAGSVLAAWLKDDRTAQIISNAKYTHAGVGHVQAGSDAGFWVVDLIRHEDGNLTPAESCPAAAAAASPRAAPERPAGRTGGSGARVTAFAVFAPPATDPAEMAAWRSAARMVCLVNRERQRHRRLPVMVDRDVMRSAVSHARKQALHSKMQHEGFADGGGGAGKPSKAWDRLRAQSREFWAAGETAARGFETEEDVVNAWMASADHRRVILNVRFNRFGSGKALSPDGTVYWTQTFAQGRHWGGHQFAVCPPGSEPPPWTKRVRTRISKAQNAGGS